MVTEDQASKAVWEKQRIGLDWPRLRFASTISIYAGAVAAGTVLIHFIALIPYPETIQHLTLWRSLLFGVLGSLGGILIAAPTAYLLFGDKPEFKSDKDRPPRGVRTWIILGILYGLTFPFLMGGVMVPISYNIIDFFNGHLSVPQLMYKSFEGTIFAPSIALVVGSRIFYTGLWAALPFFMGGWAIDRFNGSRDTVSRKYGTWAFSVFCAFLILAFVTFAPPVFLANFGGGAQNRF